MVANCGVRIVSVCSSLETMFSNTVQLKDTHLVQSCLEIGWLGRTVAGCLSVFGSVQSWWTVVQEGVRDKLCH